MDLDYHKTAPPWVLTCGRLLSAVSLCEPKKQKTFSLPSFLFMVRVNEFRTFLKTCHVWCLLWNHDVRLQFGSGLMEFKIICHCWWRISTVSIVVMAYLWSQTCYKWQPASHLMSRRRGSSEQEDSRVCIGAWVKCYGNASVLIQKRFFRWKAVSVTIVLCL